MDPSQIALNDREKGAIPISVGTSLAIESCLGILPEHETEDPVILKVDELWVNVRTLFRNLLGAIIKEQRDVISPEALAQALATEMQTIEASVNHGSKGRVQTVFYQCSYVSINRRFPYADHRNPNTDNQRHYWLMEEASLKQLAENSPPVDFRHYDIDFDDGNGKALIVTHYALDLLNRYRFSKLLLLETHTGAVKPPLLWYTKLHGGKDLVNIPFDRMTLQLFGDSQSFRPMPSKIRRHLLTIAERYKWTPASTKAYIAQCLKDERDPVLEAFVMKLY